jgi:beta-galactosidase
MIPLEFKGDWVRNLKNWNPFSKRSVGQPGPLLVRASLYVPEPISDTFIDMSSWGKGVVFVNGFNLGRYWSYMGPQKTLYLPAPLLKRGENTVRIISHN